MTNEEIYLGDITRLLFGEVDPSFFIEVILRVGVIYLIIIFAVRLIGKRMNSMLSRVELAAMVSLAGAVGVPLQAPDRGLLPVIIVAVVIVCFERISSWLSTKNKYIERITTGNLTTLVSNGVLNLKGMQKVNISRQRLFAELRSKGIYHLGGIQRCYLEANGTFSIKYRDKPTTGLSILPGWDNDLFAELKCDQSQRICNNCGTLKQESTTCKCCGENSWNQSIG